jgi:predicted RNA-binding protein YlxR (DUF448 family)
LGKKRGHKPIRSCVGCGVKVSKERLTRLVLGGGGLIEVDPLHTSPGRGGYVCFEASCRAGLATNRRLGRALRLEGPMRFSLRFQDELTRLIPVQ